MNFVFLIFDNSVFDTQQLFILNSSWFGMLNKAFMLPCSLKRLIESAKTCFIVEKCLE